MTRSDLDSVITHFEASIEDHVRAHPLEQLAWHKVKAWVLTPARIDDVETRLLVAGVIQDVTAPAAAPTTPSPTPAPTTPAAS